MTPHNPQQQPIIYDVGDKIPGVTNLWAASTSTQEPFAIYLRITPQLAKHWLDRNPPGTNRPLKPLAMQRYAQDMRQGRWSLTAQGIEFSPTGELLNGQHRLHAIVLAGVPVAMLVGFNIDKTAQRNIDTNIIRSMKDSLSLAGESDSSNLGAILRILVTVEKAGGSFEYFKSPQYGPTREEQFAFYEKHPEIREVVTPSRQVGVVAASLAGALHYAMGKKHPDRVVAFFTSVGNGLEMEADDPRYCVREHLLKQRQSRAGSKRQVGQIDDAFALIKAWNLWLAGKKARKGMFVWKRNGPNAEPFPEIQ